MSWTLKKFEELTNQELYAILQLRNEVFVVEQNCAYQDADNKDLKSWHLCNWSNEVLVSYARLLPPGLSYEEPSIGRVVSRPSYRGSGEGRKLMQEAIARAYALFAAPSIKIGAQLYLKKFYSDLGFKQVSEPYLEDGIPHIEMVHSK